MLDSAFIPLLFKNPDKCILKEWSIYPLDGGQQVVLSIITIIMTNRVQNREKDGKYLLFK